MTKTEIEITSVSGTVEEVSLFNCKLLTSISQEILTETTVCSLELEHSYCSHTFFCKTTNCNSQEVACVYTIFLLLKSHFLEAKQNNKCISRSCTCCYSLFFFFHKNVVSNKAYFPVSSFSHKF